MLVTNKDLMVPARKNGYAVGAFNVQNLESTSAIAEAATEEKSPVIMQITPSVIKIFSRFDSTSQGFHSSISSSYKTHVRPLL